MRKRLEASFNRFIDVQNKSDSEVAFLLKEMEIEGPGTHRAQLFWRWAMGFNANAASIHYWAFWMSIMCVIAGAIGLLLSGTAIHDWYAWAQQVHIAAPPDPNYDWSQFIQK